MDDVVWQVMIASVGTGLLFSIYNLYQQYSEESRDAGERQTLAKWSIFFGVSGIVFVFIGSTLGIALALIAMYKHKYKALAKIGIFVSILTMLPWLLVILLGA